MINDMINPIGLDLTKNLHGHVRVETRDRWTGRVVDSQEKENLVTNAVARMIEATPWQYQTGNSARNPIFVQYAPLYEKAFGGLLLFDSTLTESASNMYFPSSAKLVGIAGQGSDTTNAICGSYNAAESIYTSAGYTSVWDFLTSQANGIIASLGRTSYRLPYSFFGEVEFSTEQGASRTMQNSRILGYDETNKYLYICSTSNLTTDGVTYTPSEIYRAKIDFSAITLRNICMPPMSQCVLVKSLTSSDGTNIASNWVYDKYANNFVYITGSTIHKIAIDGTHSSSTASGFSGGLAAITENYYWTYSNNVAYALPKSNPSNVQSYTLSGALSILAPFENDIAVAIPTYSTSAYRVLYPDGTVLDVPSGFSSAGEGFKSIGPFFYNSRGSYSLAAYLGTIANLDSPVTKTSSQTMKITYTLTEA